MKKRYAILSLAVLITIVSTTAICFEMPKFAEAQTGNLYYGAKGDKVAEVQRKLKQWGYYDGPVDASYGPKTFAAVQQFQRKNGLKVDGVVGPATAAAMGVTLNTGKPSTAYTPSRGGSNRNDVLLLARLIHGEARGEPYIGKVAVGAVVLNRVESPKFPNTIAGVIYQPGAFTAVADGQMWLDPDQESINAAVDALNGWDPSGGAIYYYNPAKTTSGWIWSRPVITVIGKHRFAR
ncbi:spore cortex-lytic enzyme [Mahella australiensis]|uniref:Spore cortex-lytic enzyme n=1 Tax=Mahella australiensis (strain DSM 15567 / CIP 107919 / 50-1 BON) TaxID=697281 RepID=F4A2I2_MAHA5|nr:spore cortex-lytic enzyme [Mahella australiensis 50-1 BON]